MKWYIPTCNEIDERIKNVKRITGVTAREIALQSGMTEGTLSGLRHGKDCHISTLEALDYVLYSHEQDYKGRKKRKD